MQERIRKPRAYSIGFIDKDREFKKKFLKTNEKATPRPKSNLEYHPTAILGICNKCKTMGTVEFPSKFSYKVGDRAMDRKTFECFCVKCNCDTTFVPVDFKNANSDAFRWAAQVQKGLIEKGDE